MPWRYISWPRLRSPPAAGGAAAAAQTQTQTRHTTHRTCDGGLLTPSRRLSAAPDSGRRVSYTAVVSYTVSDTGAAVRPSAAAVRPSAAAVRRLPPLVRLSELCPPLLLPPCQPLLSALSPPERLAAVVSLS